MGARIALLVALIVGTMVGAAWLYRSDPTAMNVLGGCRFFESTGYLCPGCGGTRAMHAFLHLKWGTALWFNPLVFVAVVLFLILANIIARELVGPRYPIPLVRIPAAVGWALGGLVLGFWFVRNIPAWPFTLLGP